MADRNPTPLGNGRGKTRRDLSLDEIEHVSKMLLTDLATMKSSIEVILCEVREAREAS